MQLCLKAWRNTLQLWQSSQANTTVQAGFHPSLQQGANYVTDMALSRKPLDEFQCLVSKPLGVQTEQTEQTA